MNKIYVSLLALSLSAGATFAAGTSGGAAAAPAPVMAQPKAPTTSPMQLHCGKGQVVKTVKKNGKKTKMCAKAVGSLVPDSELYQQAYLLAKTGEYDWAIEVLSSIQNQNDPDVMNMLGYSNRKAGRLELGISYYSKALEMRPDFVRAREYLGEGYVAAGKLELARAQLDEIAKICGTTCNEYKDLSEVINGQTL
jgi:tetratricopeptide (TPR) repeat protein